MRKKTAPSTREHRNASISRQSGLIARGNNTKRSETEKCVLDNRSHRTSCASAAEAEYRILGQVSHSLPMSAACAC